MKNKLLKMGLGQGEQRAGSWNQSSPQPDPGADRDRLGQVRLSGGRQCSDGHS